MYGNWLEAGEIRGGGGCCTNGLTDTVIFQYCQHNIHDKSGNCQHNIHDVCRIGGEMVADNRVTVRLSSFTREQIAGLRKLLGINSDAKVIALAIDRMVQQELEK